MPASLRSDGVRVHPGMPFGFPPEYAFGFAGIPTSNEMTEIMVASNPVLQLTGLTQLRAGLASSELKSPDVRTLVLGKLVSRK